VFRVSADSLPGRAYLFGRARLFVVSLPKGESLTASTAFLFVFLAFGAMLIYRSEHDMTVLYIDSVLV
jgi:hypothetical protein